MFERAKPHGDVGVVGAQRPVRHVGYRLDQDPGIAAVQ